MNNKLLLIGLDSAEPELILGRWREELKNLSHLADSGISGRIRSTIPPITVPAWASMVTGKDPGALGFYGFRNRKDFSYDGLSIVTSKNLVDKTIWDILGERGKESVVVSVPPGYPPKPLRGYTLSCFLTPDSQSQYTYPIELKKEIEDRFGEYIFDVRNFRTEDKDRLLCDIYEMAEQRFDIVKYLIKNKPWDFFIFVEMGVDRIQHGFWKFADPEHIKYEYGNRYENVLLEYYRFIDRKIGELLEIIDDRTRVMVVSDHGAKRMDGGICINEWLIKEGYLTVENMPDRMTKLSETSVIWNKTRAWAEGGYYGRLFLNMKGREPEGTVEHKDYDTLRDELIAKIESIPDDNGNLIATKVYKPEEIYSKLNGTPPDLIILFGNLYWRSVGTIGHNTIWVHENDTGPDDANHSQYGIFILSGKGIEKAEVEGDITDVFSTVLKLFDIDIPDDVEGRVLI